MFDIANLSLDVITLLLRIAVVFLLYFFLWQVLRAITRDLRIEAAPASANPYGQLVVTSAGQTGLAVGKSFPLGPNATIGRSTSTDIALNDNFLSAEHARMEMQGDEWLLEDLGSTNGTFVNGFEVRGLTPVNDGDIIRVGRVELKLVRA
ncbi:MAG: FHA domain-containing protein [Chloroflexaceae bacterium]|jgi:pSer/pThr/pTyr-binding forkhead associated (FHA) protein|nr:FHA domain-containing protein [Chloroflexaceae bacterium]